jgi:hypothetical protein
MEFGRRVGGGTGEGLIKIGINPENTPGTP